MRSPQGGKYSAYYVVLIADITAFLAGTALAWSSPMLGTLESNDISKIPLGRKITSDEESWIGSLSAMGAIFGPIVYGYLNATAGRKWAITLAAVPFLCAYLIAAFAKTVWLFYVARVFMGIGIGGVFNIINTYAAEIAESRNRGILCGSVTTYIMAGILFSNCVGSYTSVMVFNLILCAICILYPPIFMYIGTESPYFLVSKNKDEEALKTIKYLRGQSSGDQQKEIEQIKEHLNQLEQGSFRDIFKTKGSIKAFLYSITLTTFQQFSGINVILFFTMNIFEASGSDISPEVCSIIVAAVQFISSFGTPLSVDKFGRRRVLLIAITGSVIGEIILGVYFYLQKIGDDVSGINWLPVVALGVFIAFYNFGMGSLPWLLMAEILPTNVVSPAAAFTTSFYWATGFFLTKYFGDLSVAIGMAGSFWLFAGFGVFFGLFIYFFMFETMGKTLKEIQDILSE